MLQLYGGQLTYLPHVEKLGNGRLRGTGLLYQCGDLE